MKAPPVKVLAQKHGITVEQPDSLKAFTLNPNTYTLGITAQYGGLIPKHILDSFKSGMLNVHTSLLPKYRGASPIQHALMNGDRETGVTIMLMNEGLDTGPILLQKTLIIDPNDTYEALDKKLAVLGREALLETVPKYVGGELKPTAQDDTQATTCKKLSRDDGRIDWNKSSGEIYNQYRGLTPWPGIWTLLKDKRLKLLRVIPAKETIEPGNARVDDGRLFIGCGAGSIEVTELQLEGKNAMSAAEFVRGYAINDTLLS